MTKKIEVHNLESSFPGPEYTFTDVTPEWAVCYAEAQRTNRAWIKLTDIIHSVIRHRGQLLRSCCNFER